MDPKKRKRLEAKGWKVGSATEFLGLSEAEERIVEMKAQYVRLFSQLRKQRGYTQNQVAKQINSSQSRVAKMEAGDPSVSLDLLMRGLLVLGASREALARAVKHKPVRSRKRQTQTA